MSVSRNRIPTRRRLRLAAVCGLALLAASSRGAAHLAGESAGQPGGDRPPNIVVITADDLGWGDLGSYGHPNIRTPHLDRMAAEGQRWTSFYSQAPVCSPSRAALLTGRIHLRSGMFGRRQGVFFPDSRAGLPAEETTLAEALRDAGYATGIVGKWHLGHRPEYLPTRHGFDSWLGIPYSNDMDWQVPGGPERRAAMFDPRTDYWHVPLMRDETVIERPADQRTVTRRYAEEAVSFIEAHRDEPFFLYLPHTMPHMPLFGRRTSGAGAAPASTATSSRRSTGRSGRSSRRSSASISRSGPSSCSRATTAPGSATRPTAGRPAPSGTARGRPSRAACGCPACSGGRGR